jgi:hypothetical protein
MGRNNSLFSLFWSSLIYHFSRSIAFFPHRVETPFKIFSRPRLNLRRNATVYGFRMVELQIVIRSGLKIPQSFFRVFSSTNFNDPIASNNFYTINVISSGMFHVSLPSLTF